MGQRHVSVLQISASPKLQKLLLMHRNIKFKEHVNITMTLSLLLVGNKRIVATLIVYILIIKPTRCTNFSNLFLE
jgi:hypothetical protein